jgi:hypothetical protein
MHIIMHMRPQLCHSKGEVSAYRVVSTSMLIHTHTHTHKHRTHTHTTERERERETRTERTRNNTHTPHTHISPRKIICMSPRMSWLLSPRSPCLVHRRQAHWVTALEESETTEEPSDPSHTTIATTIPTLSMTDAAVFSIKHVHHCAMSVRIVKQTTVKKSWTWALSPTYFLD